MRRWLRQRGRIPAFACLELAVVLAVMLRVGSASGLCRAEGARPLIVLRDDQGDPGVAITRGVDEALERSLATYGPFEVKFSPTPFSEVAEMAGCEAGHVSECAGRIAQVLALDARELDSKRAEWVLVRQVQRLSTGGYRVALVARDGPRAQTSRRSQTERAPGAEHELYGAVSTLLSQLYGPAPSTQPLVAKPAARGRRVDPREAIGWTSVGVAGALLSTGIAVGTFARHDERTYAGLTIQDAQDAARADNLLRQAQQRARIANALFVASAAGAALGAGLLVWRYLGERRAKAPLRVAASPTWHGASLLLQGTFGHARRERLP